MKKQSFFNRIILLGLLMAYAPSASAMNAVKAFGTSWHRFVTGKTLSNQQSSIVRRSASLACTVAYGYAVIDTLVSLYKIQRDMIKGIEEHNNDLVRRTIPKISFKNNQGDYILRAICNNNYEALEMLLQNAFNPDQFSIYSARITPLCFALAHDDFKAAHILLDHGANPLCSNITTIKPLDFSYKNEAIAQKMQQSVEKLAKELVDKKAPQFCVEFATPVSKITPYQQFITAIQKHDHATLHATFSKSSPTWHAVYIQHALWYALYNNNHDALELLLKTGVNPSMPLQWIEFKTGLKSVTPLCIALSRNDFKSADLLLEYGADANARCSNNMSAIDFGYKNEALFEKMKKRNAYIEYDVKRMAYAMKTAYRKNTSDTKSLTPQESL